MTLIEGVGDEVVQFAAVVFILVVAALAWWSTNAHPDRYRTVLVMRSHAHPITVSIRRRRSTQALTAAESPVHTGGSNITTEEGAPAGNRPLVSLQEMDSIVDADVAMMNNHRLHFYRRVDSPASLPSAGESTSDESETQDETEPASNAQIREMDSIVSAMEADGSVDPFPRSTGKSTRETQDEKEPASNAQIREMDSIVSAMEADGSVDPFPRSTESSTREAGDTKGESTNVSNTTSETQSSANQQSIEVAAESKILIKLKYLNDTLKEVDGSLDELIVDFKCRHFSTELSSQCRVRLIYNGRVLNEGQTLRACGLHDRAVVHCLVHPTRNNTQRVGVEEAAMGVGGGVEIGVEGGGAARGGRDLSGEAGGERAWDLENVLMTLVSVALTIVWFFRCEYSNMFTASASVALFGLTVFYSVAIFGLYLSDTFHFERRPPPAVPNN